MYDDQARRWVFGGRVQGVGFRPFVYRTARRYALEGWVRNLAGRVEVLAQGEAESLDRFGDALIREAPALSRPEMLEECAVPRQVLEGFAIRGSLDDGLSHVRVPPDSFACDDCLAELRDPASRRYRHPFINCTQCGPRFTLIERLPYDRANTTMAGFPFCDECAAEYHDPFDRRFHAEPLACPACGPRLTFARDGRRVQEGEDALAACVEAIHAGEIVAVKGIGGYHLVCDATRDEAVALLRARKRRPHKPLAVMFPADDRLAALHEAVYMDASQEAFLRDALRPILLLPRRRGSRIARQVAPGCAEIGVFLPYSPLHHLLLAEAGMPLVATSANPSGEPVLTRNDEVTGRLGRVADAFLHHDRPIVRPADDPVFRPIAGAPRPIRIGRGNAPLEIALPFELPQPTLALGGHLKNTIALGWQDRAIVSPHLGDMDAPRSTALLERTARDLQALYGVQAEAVACDAHRGYASSRIARRMGLPLYEVFHHRAHASALAGELGWIGEDTLVFTWDGVGYGEDHTLWGGEAFLGRPGAWQRVASLRPFSLPGGDRAAREPWRMALSLLWETGRPWRAHVPADAAGELLHHAWVRELHCPRTSSAGRLFDAAAALLGLVKDATFEAQAAMAVEAAATTDAEAESLPLMRRDGLWITDWEPLLDRLEDASGSVADRAASFHASLAAAIVDQARAVRGIHGVARIGLTGGVFQNRLLCEGVIARAAREGFEVGLARRVPCNDAGLAFGQLVEAGAL